MPWIAFLLTFAGFYFFTRGCWVGGGWLFLYVLLSLPFLLTGLTIWESFDGVSL